MVDAICHCLKIIGFQGDFSWVGFHTYYMAYDVQDRVNGQSSLVLLEAV